MFQLSYIRAQLQTMHTHAQLYTEIHTDTHTQTQSKMHTYMITKIRSEEPAFFSGYLSVEETLLFLFLLLIFGISLKVELWGMVQKCCILSTLLMYILK